MYNIIINPLNGISVNINSRQGKKILKNYLSVILGGSGAAEQQPPQSPSQSPSSGPIPMSISPEAQQFIANLLDDSIGDSPPPPITPEEARMWQEYIAQMNDEDALGNSPPPSITSDEARIWLQTLRNMQDEGDEVPQDLVEEFQRIINTDTNSIISGLNQHDIISPAKPLNLSKKFDNA